jgi:hypothetical protein
MSIVERAMDGEQRTLKRKSGSRRLIEWDDLKPEIPTSSPSTRSNSKLIRQQRYHRLPDFGSRDFRKPFTGLG